MDNHLKNGSKKKLAEYVEHMYPKIYSTEDNKNLPVPRLEARAYELSIVEHDYKHIVIYGVVRLDLFDKIVCSPISFTKVGCVDSFDNLKMPFRMEGDMLNDMFELKLPGYFVKPNEINELSLKDEGSLPYNLKDKMKKRSHDLN